MAYGNTSVSSLLNQARAALKKQQGLEEEIAAYEYDLSPKDQAAFDKYNSFLSNRIKQVQNTDQSKALSLQRKITGAQRTFTSSELTRESIGIAEGTGSKPAKLNKMISLYRRALENGDENLAQRIQLQADNLQVQIQNEAMAGAGRGGGGGGGGAAAADPQVKGFKKTVSDMENHKQLLDEELRSGRITTKDYLGGYKDKDGNQVLGVRGTMQSIGDIQKAAYEYAQSTGTEDAINYYGAISNKIKKDGYQDLINQAGKKVAAGQAGGARQYDFNTGRWEFKSPQQVGTQGYNNTDMGAMFKLKDQSKDNIVLGETKDGASTGYQVYLPKNQMNQVSEQKSGDTIKSQQYTGFLPGQENTPSSKYFGGDANLSELVYTQDENGKVVGVTPSILATNPVTGQLNRDPVTGEVRQVTAEDLGAAGTTSSNPFVAFGQGLENDFTDLAKKGTAEASKVIGSANKSAQILKANSLAKGLGIGDPFGPFKGFMNAGANISGLVTKLTGMKAAAEKKAAADAAARAAEFQRNQQAIAAANAQTAVRQTQAAKGLPVITPTINRPTPQAQVIGSQDFNKAYLGGFGNLLNKYLR